MSDTIINVRSGFYDAIEEDRVYSADDMNKPYKKLVSDGVFATPQGTPSSDLQVVPGNGMSVNVSKGNGMCAGKWFENNSIVNFVIPSNTALNSRIDSVLMQVDARTTGRVGNLVYRTGTAAADPVPPVINTVTDVTEYRLANILVEPGATEITASNITDKRGSDECPWISALVIQPDVSTLWQNFFDAYEAQLAAFESEMDSYQQTAEQAWNDFFNNLTQQLSVTMNLVTLKNTYTATGSVTQIPIGISSYNPSTDVLLVFINGLLAAPSMYTESSSTVTLTNAISAGNKVDFLVLKSVVEGDLASTVSLIQTLDAQLSAFMSDSGWIEATLETGSGEPNNPPSYRSIGGKIYIRGDFTGSLNAGDVICTLPLAYAPEKPHRWTQSVLGNNVYTIVILQVDVTGELSLIGSSAAIGNLSVIPLETNYLSANVPTITISDLPNGDSEVY